MIAIDLKQVCICLTLIANMGTAGAKYLFSSHGHETA
jgi:hypothetical protein